MNDRSLPSRLAWAAALLLSSAFLRAAEAPAFDGGDYKKYWQDVCARCHGATGNGRDASGSPLPKAGFDFTDSRKANRKKDADWVRILLEGKDEMPAFKGKLTEAQATRMVTEILRPFAAKH
jgi:mono/diheme cytochrome c family protein